jgi:large subunit ribosomal protein L21
MATTTKKKQAKQDTGTGYAIFQTGGKQYQALEGKTLGIEKLDTLEGESVTFKEVLLRKTSDGAIEIGQPYVKTPIKAVIIKHIKGPKLIAFKFKRRKKYARKIGHRQPITVIRIVAI